jgi:hypothetical protein
MIPVSFSQPTQQTYFVCDWISALCRSVQAIAMKVLQKIKNCFSADADPITLAPTRVAETSAMSERNLIPFYLGLEANNNGVTLNQILSWNDDQLETVHNYIQWLFPLPERSGPNPTAPVLTQETITTFRCDLQLRNNMLRCLRRMASFYGLQVDENTWVITRGPDFVARSAVWLHNPAGHHNFLRITRIIRSLYLLAGAEYATNFFNIMADIYRNEGRGVISPSTFEHWARAQQGRSS